MDAAGEIEDLGEAGVLQNLLGPGGAHAVVAHADHIPRFPLRQLTRPRGEFPQRNMARTGQRRDGQLFGLAHIQHQHIIFAIQSLTQFFNGTGIHQSTFYRNEKTLFCGLGW